MTQEELYKLKVYATLSGELDKYVYLREDKEGKYIEYAFQKGAPHDNRCLSWYDSYQENAYIRNKWCEGLSEEGKHIYLDAIKSKRDRRVGKIFKLHSFTCGYEEDLKGCLENSKENWQKYHPNEPFIPEDHICKVGNPANKCKETRCKYWTYKEPVKCACWYLLEVYESDYSSVNIPIDIACKLFEQLKDYKL